MRNKRVLMVAYHFPPLAGSSGVQRTLRFVQHLPEFGWEALVLAPDPRAYESTSDDLSPEIPSGTVVRRTFALDAARHLAIGGKYFGWTACPDRWISWRFAGIREGLRLIDEFRPQAIWSTYPIATAHVIGHALASRSGLPWVADFRDPMAQDGYPTDPETWRSFKRIEEFAIRQAALCTFTTEGAARLYRQRYPGAPARIDVLENGYDEAAFALAERDPAIGTPLNPGCVTLLHSGIVYPDERDPRALFAALGRLAAADASIRAHLRVRFRAPVHSDLLQRLGTEHGLGGIVEALPPLPYQAALAEMLRADALLVLQAANCNEQIPAKVYEYLRAGRPVVAFADRESDTGRLLGRNGIETMATLANTDGIAAALARFVADPASAPAPSNHSMASGSRLQRSRQLAGWLDEIAAGHSAGKP